jgi:hypothetical protein
MLTIEEGSTLLFMHQMKSGGVTLRRIIEDQYNQKKIYRIDGKRFRKSVESFIDLPAHERKQFQVITGHMFFGLHRFVRRPCKYITMLRHPIDRVISLYYYQLRPQHKFHIPPSMSLIDYLEQGVAVNADNGMTRFIAGKDSTDVPYGQCANELLDRAVANVKDHFLAIGLTERFDESLVLFKRALKWEKMPYYHNKLNINPLKPQHIQLTNEALAAIKKYNRLDLQLYEYADRWFEALISQQDSSFQQELQMLYRSNQKIG